MRGKNSMSPFEIEGKKYYSEDEIKNEVKKNELDEQVDEVADKIVANIDSKVAEAIEKQLGKNSSEKVKKIMKAEKVTEKDVKELTKDEKIVSFFQAMVHKDTAKLKALSEGTAADGGYLFPDEFRAELVQQLYDDPYALRNLVRVIPMKRDIMKIPTLVARPLTFWTSELETKTTTSAEFYEATLTAYKLAAIIYASDELIADSDQIDVVKTIISLFATEISIKENQAIAAGTGVGQPTGLVTATITNVTCSGNLDFDDIIDLIYALPSGYRPNASFLVHNANIKELRKIQDGSGRYIWQDAMGQGLTATIYGYPVYECNHLPESEIYFGDFKRGYYLGDRQRMTVKITQDSETAFTKDLTGIRVVARLAGNVVLADAIRCLNSIP